jgi:hypothetical protein
LFLNVGWRGKRKLLIQAQISQLLRYPEAKLENPKG